MIQLSDTKIFVGGTDASSLRHDSDWAVVNTAKNVHCEILNWDNRPPRDHPNYLVLERDQLLSFNWVDGPAHLYNWSGSAAFVRALDFIDRWYHSKSVLIHCNQGQSRSPTVALLYLAKRLCIIPDSSFAAARAEFQLLYPSYNPAGIADYVSSHWSEIN